MSSSYFFDNDSPQTEALLIWWRELEKNRGDRAELRRCHNLTEVAFSPAYHRLRLALIRVGSVNDDRLTLVAGLASRVKVDSPGNSIAEQMATPKEGSKDKAKVSGLRFRRLLKVKEQEELFTSMSRIIALLGGAVNLRSLAQSVYFWNDKTRKRWAYDYYSKATSEA